MRSSVERAIFSSNRNLHLTADVRPERFLSYLGVRPFLFAAVPKKIILIPTFVEDIDPRFPEADQQIRKTPPVARRASGAFVSWLITDAADDAPAATATVTGAASLNVSSHRNKK
jgi:hypothetical protein